LAGDESRFQRCLFGVFTNPDASRQAKIEYSAFGAAQNTLLNLGRGPEFCESEGPTSVDNTIPSGVRHALP
jgi:hypothetical protein